MKSFKLAICTTPYVILNEMNTRHQPVIRSEQWQFITSSLKTLTTLSMNDQNYVLAKDKHWIH